MDVNLDIGNNLTGLLQKLADQIGVTAQQIFPWYVQQAKFDGMVSLIALTVAFFVFVLVIILSSKYAKWNDGPDNGAAIVSIIGAILLGIWLVIAPFEYRSSILKVLNPQYYAMEMITTDLGKLTRK